MRRSSPTWRNLTTPRRSGAGSFDLRAIDAMHLGLGRSLPVRGGNTALPQPRALCWCWSAAGPAAAARRGEIQRPHAALAPAPSISGPPSVRRRPRAAAFCSAAALLRPRSRLPFAVAGLRQPQQAFDAHAPLQGQPLRSRAQCHHSTSPMWHPAGWVSPWCWLLRAAAGNGHGNGSRHPHAPQPTGMPMPTGHRAPSPPPQLGPAARGPIQYS